VRARSSKTDRFGAALERLAREYASERGPHPHPQFGTSIAAWNNRA